MIRTRLTDQYGLGCPIIQAPMAIAAGGKLAAAVSNSGGMGLIGGGYGNIEWIVEQIQLAKPAQVGCGLITWSLKEKPGLLPVIIDMKPVAIFLSFGNPQPFARQIKDSGITLICQVQTLDDAISALDNGADIVVAQGSEAGGHGEVRGTFTLVPEVADYISRYYPKAVLCAAGGIADGRGLSAALMLGADGVVIGTRFWATKEALVHPNMHQSAIGATGDMTIRSSVMDIARRLKWPSRYTARVLKNGFTEQWHDRTEELMAVADREAENWKAAWAEGNTSIANTFVGEATGIIDSIVPVDECIRSLMDEASSLLDKSWG